MIKLQFFATLTVLGLTVFAALGQSNTQANERTLSFLKKFRTDFIKGMLNEEPEIIQTYFAEDIRLMPEFQKTVMNEENALLYWKSFADRFNTQEFNRTEIEILDIGSRIIEIGSFTSRMKLKSDGRNFELKGKYIDLWERKGEQILLLTQAWNYDHAVNFGDQLKFADVPSVIIAYEAHLPVDNPVRFELAALNRLMEKSITEHDAKIWSQFYANDASWLYTGNSLVQGRKCFLELMLKRCRYLKSWMYVMIELMIWVIT